MPLERHSIGTRWVGLATRLLLVTVAWGHALPAQSDSPETPPSKPPEPRESPPPSFGFGGPRGDFLSLRTGVIGGASGRTLQTLPKLWGRADQGDPLPPEAGGPVHVAGGPVHVAGGPQEPIAASLEKRVAEMQRPLAGTSWLNRPRHAGWFVGGVFPGSLSSGIDQQANLVGGFRLGHDRSHHWGTEWRIGFAHPGLEYPGAALTGGNSDLWFLDYQWLYYPWGDTRWRPYAAWGLGVTGVSFHDPLKDRSVDELLVHLPLGVGIKYHHRKWLVLRAELHNNLAVGGGDVKTLNNFMLTGSVEVRFGGWRRSYFPWNPAVRLW